MQDTIITITVRPTAVLESLALQHGVPVHLIRHSVSGPIAAALDLVVDGVPVKAASS